MMRLLVLVLYFQVVLGRHGNDEGLPGGAYCHQDEECQSHYCVQSPVPTNSRSVYHIIVAPIPTGGYCSLASSQYPGFVGQGGLCEQDAQCASRYCVSNGQHKFCARESSELGHVGAGGQCTRHSQCYSSFCGPSDTEDPSLRICSATSRKKGLVGGGGRCIKNEDCFSNFCFNRPRSDWHQRCSIDAPKIGYIGGGGPCMKDEQCYSKRCIRHPDRTEFGIENLGPLNFCGRHSPKLGFLGGGGVCAKDKECYAKFCIKESNTGQGYCAKHTKVRKRIDEGGICPYDKRCYSNVCVRLGNISVCAKNSMQYKKVGGGGPCIHDRDCFSGKCTHRRANYGNLTAYSTDRKKSVAHVCARDGPKRNSIGGGGLCHKDKECFSRVCIFLQTSTSKRIGICAAEVRPARTEHGVPLHSRKPRMAVDDGGPCRHNEDCGSGICVNFDNTGRFCAKSSVFGHKGIGEGGRCNEPNECASRFCAAVHNRTDGTTVHICSKESPKQGFVGNGGFCDSNAQCLSNYCVTNHVKIGSDSKRISFCARAGSHSGTVGLGGPCSTNKQCESNRCGRITLVGKENAPAAIAAANGKQICVPVSMDEIMNPGERY